MAGTWREYDELKRQCARELRAAGHKSMQHAASRKRTKFAKPDDSKIKDKFSKVTYWEWVQAHGGHEPTEGNADLFEETEDKADGE